MSRVTLVLGGARSGKSRYAEGLAQGVAGPRQYIATAEAFDAEMQARIAAHRVQRGEGWITHEAPLDLLAVVNACRSGFVLIDCITVWLGNLMHHGRDWHPAVAELCAALRQSQTRLVVVSNEVGMGLVPDTALGRAFRDAQGLANQKIAEAADEVVFVVAGLPLWLKNPPAAPGGGASQHHG